MSIRERIRRYSEKSQMDKSEWKELEGIRKFGSKEFDSIKRLGSGRAKEELLGLLMKCDKLEEQHWQSTWALHEINHIRAKTATILTGMGIDIVPQVVKRKKVK